MIPFQTVPQLRAFAAGLRGRPGIVAIAAALWREFVLAAAGEAVKRSSLEPGDDKFLRSACRSVSSLVAEPKGNVYVQTSTLFRLHMFLPPPTPISVEVAAAEEEPVDLEIGTAWNDLPPEAVPDEEEEDAEPEEEDAEPEEEDAEPEEAGDTPAPPAVSRRRRKAAAAE
jgi:hypothetical protein